jgi:hypothetical protein
MSVLLFRSFQHLYKLLKVYLTIGLFGALAVLAFGALTAYPYLGIIAALVFLFSFLIDRVPRLRGKFPAFADNHFGILPDYSIRHEIKQLTRQAEEKLSTVPQIQFSPQALQVLRTNVTTYVIELSVEALKVARRNQSPDAICADHVAQAAKHMVSKGISPPSRLVGLFAGAFLGAAFSGMVSMAIAGAYPVKGVIATVAFATVGAFMSGFYFAKKEHTVEVVVRELEETSDSASGTAKETKSA